MRSPHAQVARCLEQVTARRQCARAIRQHARAEAARKFLRLEKQGALGGELGADSVAARKAGCRLGLAGALLSLRLSARLGWRLRAGAGAE